MIEPARMSDESREVFFQLADDGDVGTELIAHILAIEAENSGLAGVVNAAREVVENCYHSMGHRSIADLRIALRQLDPKDAQ